MDCAGTVIALADLALRCYHRCSQASGSFDDLQYDLHSLNASLLAVAPLMREGREFSSLREGCGKIVSDIEKLLSKYESLGTTDKKIIDKIGWSSADTSQLRSRLTAQVSMLNLYLTQEVLTMVKSGHSHHFRSRGESPGSSQSTGRDGGQIWDIIYRELRNLRAPESSIDAIRLLLFEEPTPSEISYPDTPASLPSTISIINADDDKTQLCNDNLSMSSNRASSVASSERKHQSLSSTLKAKLKSPQNNFTAAAKDGDITTLRRILNNREQKSQLDQKCFNKALVSVSSNEKRKREQTEVVRLLLSQGAELECCDAQHGRTPLIWAITVGREDIVDVLLDNKALIEARDKECGCTPLMWAVGCGNEPIMKQLIKRGASLEATDGTCGRTPLSWAAKKGTCGAAEILLQENRELIEVKDKKNLTPLAQAYVEGHEAVARVLVRYRANPNFKFDSGTPLLISAILSRDKIFICLLVENGADIDCKGKDGVPALSVAVKEGRVAVAEFLVRKGAQLEARDSQGRTALLWAVGRCRRDLVELLLRNGANKYAADSDGRTVQKWAELTGDSRIIKLVS